MSASLRPAVWTPRRIIFFGVVGAILAASLAAGTRLMNARVDERDAGARDAKRMADMQVIVAAAQEIFEREGVIPKSLDELQAKSSGRLSLADPQTFEVYEYRVPEERRFEVCARFEEAASGGPSEHGAGRSCFQVEVK